MGDIDGDGDLDLWIAARTDRLLRNDGGFAFTDVSANSLPASTVDSSAIALLDADGDGDLHAYLGSYWSQDRLYENDGSGRFRDASTGLPATFGETMGAAAGDLDDDGDLDVLVAVSNRFGYE
jgi:hypothetical protein